MKRKQNIPRRIRPIGIIEEKPALLDASDEPLAKRIKSDPEKEPECTCNASDPSEWKWNIADFRKEHSENLKEEINIQKELTNNSKEHPHQIEQPSNDSKKESSNSSIEEFKKNLGHLNERVNNCLESSESSKKSVTSTEETKNVCAKDGKYMKESLLRNPPQILRNQNEAVQSWKPPAEGLKEPLRCVKLQSPLLEMFSNTNTREKKVSKFGNEDQNNNMPVILNVFSLSKDPAQQFIANTKQVSSVLCTPPCSPPLVQLGTFSVSSVPSQNPRFRNEFFNQTAFQQPGRENRYKQVQHSYKNFQEQSNKPTQRVYYNYQENFSKPVQQVSSQEYFIKPVKQVFYTPQECHSKPVQQGYSPPVHIQQVYNPQAILPKTVRPVNSQGYLNNTVQQVYTPQEYFPKTVPPANLQVYSNYSAEQGNPTHPESWSNPVQNVNRQKYVYNHVPHNSTQIANGVLPLERQTSNQNLYEVQTPINTAQFPNQRYHNYVNSNEPVSQLKSIPNETYSVVNGNAIPEGNGLYTRFKLKPSTAEVNKASYHANSVSSLILETPITQDMIKESVEDQASGTAGGHFDTSSSVYIHNGLKSFSNCTDGISVQKYRTETFGRNSILQDVHTTNTEMYDVNVSGNFLPNPTTVSEKQSIYSDNSPGSTAIYIPVSSEAGKGEFLTARDAKVIQLKQRLEEQEATLKKLRENH